MGGMRGGHAGACGGRGMRGHAGAGAGAGGQTEFQVNLKLGLTRRRDAEGPRGYAGLGHVYEGGYKSFPVENGEHFWVVARYVQRNALRTNLVLRAEDGGGQASGNAASYGRRALVVGGVADRYASELARAGQSNRQRAGTGSISPQRATRPPLGQPEWQKEIAQRLGLESAYRPTGRPRKVGRNQNVSPG